MGDGLMCHYCRRYRCICPEAVAPTEAPQAESAAPSATEEDLEPSPSAFFLANEKQLRGERATPYGDGLHFAKRYGEAITAKLRAKLEQVTRERDAQEQVLITTLAEVTRLTDLYEAAARERDEAQRKLDEINAPGYACGILYGMNQPYVGGCGKKVLQHESYRCADCTASFHRDCINDHFESDAYIKALRDERMQQPLKDWKESHANERQRAEAAEQERDAVIVLLRGKCSDREWDGLPAELKDVLPAECPHCDICREKRKLRTRTALGVKHG